MTSVDPIRTCVGCGRKAPQAALVRYTSQDGMLARDGRRRAPGRGVYTCADDACRQRALARRAFPRALRAPVQVPLHLQGVSQAR